MSHARHEVGEISDLEWAAQSTGVEMPGCMEKELLERDEDARDSQIMPDWWFDPVAPPRREDESLAVPLDGPPQGPPHQRRRKFLRLKVLGRPGLLSVEGPETRLQGLSVAQGRLRGALPEVLLKETGVAGGILDQQD